MIATQLAPFIAWLATREPDEATRRRHRLHVQAYLEYAAQHGGVSDRTQRAWEARFPQQDRTAAERAAALARFTEHRLIIERTRVET
jgi:hypothetical protein